MIIEVFGLPGVGKSSFVKAWIQINRRYKNIKVISRLELLFLNLLYFFHYPKNFIISFFLIIRYGGSMRLMYSKFMNLFLHYNAHWVKAGFHKLAILDQGHMMSVLSLFEQGISSEFMLNVYNNINKPDILVVLEASDDIRHNRLQKRGYGIRGNMSAEYGDKFLSAMNSNYIKVKNLICSDKTMQVVVINTDKLSSEEVVNRVKIILDL